MVKCIYIFLSTQTNEKCEAKALLHIYSVRTCTRQSYRIDNMCLHTTHLYYMYTFKFLFCFLRIILIAGLRILYGFLNRIGIHTKSRVHIRKATNDCTEKQPRQSWVW